MLQCERIDMSEVIDVNKTIDSRSYIVYDYCH